MRRVRIERRLLGLLLVCLTLATGRTAFAGDDVAQALAELAHQDDALTRIALHVERPDLGRILLIEAQVKIVANAIRADGLANTATMNEYEVLVLRYRYSHELFARIRTDWTGPIIDGLLAEVAQMAHERGLDRNPAVKTVKNIFMQIFQLVNAALGETLPPGLAPRLRTLVPALGVAISAADLGDRPEAFAAATPVYKQIVELYPEFYAIRTSEPAYEDVVSIQGLAELYAEFAQLPH